MSIPNSLSYLPNQISSLIINNDSIWNKCFSYEDKEKKEAFQLTNNGRFPTLTVNVIKKFDKFANQIASLNIVFNNHCNVVTFQTKQLKTKELSEITEFSSDFSNLSNCDFDYIAEIMKRCLFPKSSS